MAHRSKRASLCVAIIGAVILQIGTAVYVSALNAAATGDQAGMELIDDLVRASQAEVAAERVVAMTRAYRLTPEPDMLAHARAAQTNLQQTVEGLARRAYALEEGPLFEPVLVSAGRYRELFQGLLARGSASGTPQAAADPRWQRLSVERDRLETELDELIARRQYQLAGLHASTRDQAARAVPLMVGLCVFGFIASVMLVRMVPVDPGHNLPQGGSQPQPVRCFVELTSPMREPTRSARVLYLPRRLDDEGRRR